ncbi:hypothetical protein K439DRAFT_564631 [Ramaria rubella]|nr:hypothetical protein K439DRAFT_564631 [Ramaria rubella]
MRFITIVSLLVPTAHVAVSAPVYSIARRDQGGIGAIIPVIPSWNDVIQRDYNEEDIHARQLATLLVRELLFDGPNGYFRRSETVHEGEGDDMDHIPDISIEPDEESHSHEGTHNPEESHSLKDVGMTGPAEHHEPNHHEPPGPKILDDSHPIYAEPEQMLENHVSPQESQHHS